MSSLVSFLASPAGRVVRIAAGLASIAWGLLGLGDTAGIVVAVIGQRFLLAGMFDSCVVSRLFGGPLPGAQNRDEKERVDLPRGEPGSTASSARCLRSPSTLSLPPIDPPIDVSAHAARRRPRKHEHGG